MRTVSLPLQAALPSSTFRGGRCKQQQAVQNDPATAQQHLEENFSPLTYSHSTPVTLVKTEIQTALDAVATLNAKLKRPSRNANP
ncbi:MAG TPA: hypothetical protein PLA87_24555 [Pseudomonadota bacterium]|nr:hypothetical protein [Pseudomonadota bacterium]